MAGGPCRLRRERWIRRPAREPDAQLVDLDLSAANLPPGTRLRVGTALGGVTPYPRNGGVKFNARFGNDALRLDAGEIVFGDTIEVMR